jgi:hypothetical protein
MTFSVRYFRTFAAFLALSAASPSWASPAILKKLTGLFEANFAKGYTPGRCGQNIQLFARTAKNSGLDISSGYIVEIVNRGSSLFGMVNAELARESGRASGETRLPGESNWEYHAILMYDGRIFDFDFTNEPSVLPASDYFERMFLDENPRPTGGFYIGRQTKLDEYELTLVTVADFYRKLEDRQHRPQEQNLSLRKFLQQK